MEGGSFQPGTRAPGQAGPAFEPPVEPAGPSIHGLSLVAQIMRGRELAAAAAGMPPLDSDQVLDLQRSAGNLLTTGALSRWTEVLVAALEEEGAAALARFAAPEDALRRAPHELLDHLLAARAADPAAHAAISAALDALDPVIRVRVACTAADVPTRAALAVTGPGGGIAECPLVLAAGTAAAVELRFRAAFGPAAAVAPGSALDVRLTAAEGSGASVALPVPFVAPRALALAGARLVAIAEAI